MNSPKGGRGVLYVVWGQQIVPMLNRSIASLREFHPDLPVHVVQAPENPEPFRGLLQKTAMARLSPFDQTLFLDADTVVLGKLDYGFEMARAHGLACVICESPWARRHTGLRGAGDLVEYNTGVLFFSGRSRHVFDRWEELAPHLDSSTVFTQPDLTPGRQEHDDQAAFALAVKETNFVPYALPLNWNFRPRFHQGFFGPLKIWHHPADVPGLVREWCQNESKEGAVINYHRVVPE